jgi:glutathione S-transferase
MCEQFSQSFNWVLKGFWMHYVELIATLAILQFLAFGVLTGSARRASGLKAPAVTGHEGFERMYRVQMNTLELLIAFLPSLFLAAKYWSPLLVAVIGAVYLIGRLLYWRAYVSAPSTRTLGFFLSMLPTGLLSLMALAGIALSIFGLI